MAKPIAFLSAVVVLVVAGGVWLTSRVEAGPGVFLIPFKYKGGAVADGGSIKGTVTVDPVPDVPEMVINKDATVCAHAKVSPRLVVDKATKGVGNVVVYLSDIEKGKKKVKGDFMIDQKDCHYTPHISIVPTRSKLAVKSSDPILHNVHVYRGTPEEPHSMAADLMNLAFKDASVAPEPFDKRALRKPGFFYIKCDNGHYWMSAYVWVVEHPYYALTDAKGKFELTDVPAGTYTLKYWHENWQATPVETGGKVQDYTYGKPILHEVKVTVKAGAATLADWTISGN